LNDVEALANVVWCEDRVYSHSKDGKLRPCCNGAEYAARQHLIKPILSISAAFSPYIPCQQLHARGT